MPRASCSFLLLCATFAYYSPIPTDKSTRLRLTCAPAARAWCQSASATCGGGRMEYSSPCPGLLAALCCLCYFVLLLLLLPTFCQYPQQNAPACGELVPQLHAPDARAPPPRLGAAVWNTTLHTLGFLQLCAAFCYSVLLLPTFCQYPQP